MAAQSNVNLEKCALFKCLWSWTLAHCRTDGGAGASLALKILRHFYHTDKSNTSFKSVKTLPLFVCTHNNNNNKIMKANMTRFLPTRSQWTWARNSVYIFALQALKNISIESEMPTFKWTNSNGRQVYQKNVNAVSLLFLPDTFIIITSAVRCGRLNVCAWALIRLCRHLKVHYNDLNGLLKNVWLVDKWIKWTTTSQPEKSLVEGRPTNCIRFRIWCCRWMHYKENINYHIYRNRADT